MPGNLGEWNLTSSQKDSLRTVFQEHADLSKNNQKLRAQLRSDKIDLAKLRAELESQIAVNDYLTEELKNTRDDLSFVERQFVRFEQRLQSQETKASAVAAVAEVQLLHDKMKQENPEMVDSVVTATVEQRLLASEELIREGNFPAAAYYATRAMRILNENERRRSIPAYDGETSVVSVSTANMRDGPGKRFPVLQRLAFGTVLVRLERREDWYRVRTKDGDDGWIHKALIR